MSARQRASVDARALSELLKAVGQANEERDRLRAENARLRRERDAARYQRDSILDERPDGAWMARALDAERESTRLREALRPFAAWADEADRVGFRPPNERERTLLGWVRVARAALEGGDK